MQTATWRNRLFKRNLFHIQMFLRSALRCVFFSLDRSRTNETLLNGTKLTAVFVFGAALHVSANTFGQHISIVEKDASIQKVFTLIRKQSDFTFAYTGSMLKNARPVTVEIRNGTLDSVLNACFYSQPFDYAIMGETIVVRPRMQPVAEMADTLHQPSYIEVNGRVADSAGHPLSGASVTIAGVRKGTLTDADGRFKIWVNDENAILNFSIIGFARKQVKVGADRTLTVTLTGAAEGLTDVLITGYQTKSRRLSASSSSTVAIQTVALQPVASFDQLLQGQAAGLEIKTGSGQPGRAADVVIRGKGSINGSTNPLYIVDGIQVEAKDFATMNPADFETVTILKDGASAGLYGSRGANGVVVINTRKGREGKLVIAYETQFGFSRLPPGKLKVMDSKQKVDFEVNVAGNPYGWTPSQADSLKQINYDWQGALYKTAPMQQHQLSASGGNDKTKYFTSFSYLDQDGILLKTGFRRYTARFNIEHTVNNFRFGANIAGGWSKSVDEDEGNQNTTNPLNNFLWALPYETPYTPTGAYTVSVQGVGSWTNPVEEINKNLGHEDNIKAYGTAFLEYQFPKLRGLMWRTNIGGDYSETQYFKIVKNGTQTAGQNGDNTGSQYAQGDLAQGLNKQFRYTLTNALSYRRLFGSDQQHSLNAGLYHETVRTTASGFGYTAFGLLNPFPNAAGLVAGTSSNGYIPVIDNIVYTPDNGLVSFFGTLDYVYRNKLILGGSARRDGSSRLSHDNRWVNYGGISGAYILSEEAFLKDSKSISLLKVKASYGTVGNQEGIGDFPYLQSYSSGTFAGGPALSLSAFGNKNLKWETRSTFNTGVELGLFNNRITVGAEYYNSITNHLFFNLTTPATSGGAGSVLGNAGSLRNRGIEASVDMAIVKSANVQWTVSANYALNRNTVLSLPEDQQFQLYKSFQILQVGKPLNSFYLDRFVGVDPQTGSSLYLQKDGKTKTSTYDPNDRVVLGTSDAPYNGGITNNIRFRALSLSFSWVYSAGNSIYNYARTNIEYPGYVVAGFSLNAVNAWTTPGQKTNFPSLSDPFEYNTTRYLERDNFWRLRNVTVSYQLPQRLCGRLGIQSFRLFAQGQNLLTFFSVQAFDPEVSTVNSTDSNSNADITGAQYPPLRSVTFGAAISF